MVTEEDLRRIAAFVRAPEDRPGQVPVEADRPIRGADD
jgi:hypothetical protein